MLPKRCFAVDIVIAREKSPLCSMTGSGRRFSRKTHNECSMPGPVWLPPRKSAPPSGRYPPAPFIEDLAQKGSVVLADGVYGPTPSGLSGAGSTHRKKGPVPAADFAEKPVDRERIPDVQVCTTHTMRVDFMPAQQFVSAHACW